MEKINSKHLFFIIIGLSIVSMKTYPTILTNTGGNNTWIAIIISSALILGLFIYFLKICKKFDCFSLVKIYRYSLGNFLGNFFIFLLIITLIFTLVECCSVESSSLHSNLLLETPHWYIMLFFIFPALYTLKKGPLAVMITTIITMSIIIIAGINLVILTAKYKSIKYLFPVLTDGFNLDLLLCIIKSLGLYGIILLVFPYAKDINDKSKLLKHSILSILFVIQMQIVSITGVLTTFGIDRANTLSYPKLIQTQLVNYFGFIESGEFFVMVQVVGGWFIKYILVFYCLIKILKELNVSNNKSLYFFTAVVLILSLISTYNQIYFFKLLDYYTYICFTNFILIPFIIFTVFLIKNTLSKNT